MSIAPELRVETVRDYQSFADLEPDWNRLVEEAGIDHPFLRHEWVRTWWECFGAGKQLHILVVKDGKEAVAIAPLMRSVGRMYGLRVRRLQSMYNDHTPRFHFIVARRPKEVYRAIWSSLLEERASWDVLQLGQVADGSRTLEELPRLAAADDFFVGSWRSAESPYVPVVGSWESYWKGLSNNQRKKMRNKVNRLSRLGEVKLDVISSREQLGSALEEALRIESAAWKGEAGTAILCRSEIRLFYTRLAEAAAQRGWLRLRFLTVNHKRIAFDFSLCYRNKLYVLKVGYDPQYSTYSPYQLLCYMALRDAMEQGIAEQDFLASSNEWHCHRTKETRFHYWLFVFPNGPRGRVLHAAKFRMVPLVKRLCPALWDVLLSLRKGVRSGKHPDADRSSVSTPATRLERWMQHCFGRVKKRLDEKSVHPAGAYATPRKALLRFPAAFLATLAALSLIYAAAIRTIDARGEFGAALFPVVEMDARTEKMRLLEKYLATGPLDGLILGSSRAMKLSPRELQAALSQRFFNFSVDNARAEDYLATYRWVGQHNARLKSLIIGLDVEALHNDDRPEQTLALNQALTQALRQVPSPATEAFTERTPLASLAGALRAYKRAFTITYLDDALRSVRLSLEPGSRPVPMLDFEGDGYLRYRRWEVQRATGTFRFDGDLERCLYKYFTRFKDMTALSSRRQIFLRQLVHEAQADGVKAVIWITTLPPITVRHLAAHTRYVALLDATRRYLAAMTETFGIPTYDFSSLDHYNGVATGWYDCAHIDETNAERVAAALVEALR